MCINLIQIPVDKNATKFSSNNLIGRLVFMSHHYHGYISSCLFPSCPLPKQIAKANWQEGHSHYSDSKGESKFQREQFEWAHPVLPPGAVFP